MFCKLMLVVAVTVVVGAAFGCTGPAAGFVFAVSIVLAAISNWKG